MFYFFEKRGEYLRCELRPRTNGGVDLVISEPGHVERVERFPNFADAEARWDELRIRFNVDGWAGPFSRD
jgi:hypothetical protein